MSFRLDLPPFFRDMNDAYSYLTRTINNLNYALSFLDVPEAPAGAKIRAAEDPNNKAITITNRSTNTQYPSAKAVYDYAVPQSRKVNGKTLSEDITLDAGDVGAVPDTRKVNGKRLNTDIAFVPGDLGEADYVTENGSDANGWSWRKWNSGKIDLYGTHVAATLGSTDSGWSTSGLNYKSGSITLPSVLDDADYSAVLTIDRSPNGSNAIIGAIRRPSATEITFVIFAPAVYIPSTLYLNVFVRGTAAAT